MLTNRRVLVSGLIALGIALAPLSVVAAGPHSHSPGAGVGLTLDHGKKWATDEALRRGMGEIRAAMAAAITPIHENKYSPQQYRALADELQSKVEDITKNCRLPEDADLQLHIVLEQVLEGVEAMKTDNARMQGAVKVLETLAQYGAYFEHADWQPIDH